MYAHFQTVVKWLPCCREVGHSLVLHTLTVETRIDVCIEVCIDEYMEMCIDMSIKVCVDMSVEVCIDMWRCRR